MKYITSILAAAAFLPLSVQAKDLGLDGSAKGLSKAYPGCQFSPSGTARPGAKLWGKSVESAKYKQTNGKVSSIVFELAKPGEPKQKAMLAAKEWSELISDQLGVESQALKTINVAGKKRIGSVWKLENKQFVVLSMESDPKQLVSLELSVLDSGAAQAFMKGYSQQSSSSVTKKEPSTNTDKAPASGADSVIAKQLKGRISYFEGGSYKKRDIENHPEYYILYFSASW